MKLIKKLVDWFEALLWAGAIEDVFGDHEYYLDAEDKDGTDDSSRCCYSGVKCYGDLCAVCKERKDFLRDAEDPEFAAKVQEMQTTIDRIGYLEQRCEALETREKEYKRLLKSATIVLNMFKPCDNDYNCSECIHQRQDCDYDDRFKWRYIDEALKLIGGSEND